MDGRALPALARGLGCAAVLISCLVASLPAVGSVSEALRQQLADRASGALGGGADDKIVRAIYAERGFEPVWLSETGNEKRIDAIVEVIETAEREGLRPRDYDLGRLEALRASRAARDRAELEIAATELVLRFLGDLRHGRRTPKQFDPELFVHPVEFDALELLKRAAAAADIKQFMRDEAPANPTYRRLRRALAELRSLAQGGGWPAIPAGQALKPGMVDPRVATLRKRLEASGDISPGSASESALYGPALAGAVMRFQARHGLDPDGVVGAKTVAALNVPVEERIRQIVLNMERWRWMPDDLGDRYILVNLAGFELDYVEHGAVQLSMRVVVGKPYRRSPVFSDLVRYLELNPYWTVTPNIARKDILPKVQKDPGYLRAQGMRVFQDWSDNAREVDPASIDWSKVSANRFPYRLRQDPGPLNALGRIKFMFPNRHNVYLHDTPARELFAKSERTFSSGCIRLERPQELATILLADQPSWTRSRLDAAIQTGKTERIDLKRPIPIHLTYSTAWTGEGGTLHFRPDIYGRDELLRGALETAG